MLRQLKPRPRGLSDEELFAGLLTAEPQVFDHLYETTYPMVRRTLTERSCPPQEAEDLFQEALVALWQNARDGKYVLRPGTRLSTYLTHLCVNRWIDRTRKVAFRRTESHEVVPERGDANVTDEDPEYVLRELRHARLDEAFAQLGAACQELLKRFYFERLSLEEIAEERGVSTASAKTIKYRCMQRLRRLCEDGTDDNAATKD